MLLPHGVNGWPVIRVFHSHTQLIVMSKYPDYVADESNYFSPNLYPPIFSELREHLRAIFCVFVWVDA